MERKAAMEQTGTLTSRQRNDASAVAMAKIGLLLAGFGAILIVLNLFGLGEVGVAFTVLGAGLAFLYGIGSSWYYTLAGGTIAGVVGWLLSGPHQSLGGYLAVLATVAVIVGASLGFPMDDEE